jgi:ribosome biogenesis GTPase / thiamine phosphate phosphatase
MSKRRISKQQSSRIERQQRSLQQDIHDTSKYCEGLVITRYGSHVLIEDDANKRHHCSIKPSIDSLVAGDKVVWLPESEEQGVVVSRYPRDTTLGRPDKRGNIKPVAANITQMIVVIAPNPEVSWHLLDSYLVIAEQINTKACIVLNKTDLPCQQVENKLKTLYQPLGYNIVYATSNEKRKVDLEQHLTNENSVFVGQSGVGKSTLISSVLPHEVTIETGAISDVTHLGRHTTSNSTYYHLPIVGGAIIDSPGVREFGLWHMPAPEIAKGFKEFLPFLSQCKFRDCDHEHSPGCALIQAVKEDKISSDRLKNYVKISAKFSK